MSTATLAPTLETPTAEPIPFSRLIMVEFRKFLAPTSHRWLIGVAGIVTALIMVVTYVLAWRANVVMDFALMTDIVSAPAGILVPIVALLSVTSEFSRRTYLSAFTIEPSRVRVICAKLVMVLCVGLACAAIAYALGAVSFLLNDAASSKVATMNFSWPHVGAYFSIMVITMTLGFAFGLAFLNTATAVVLYLLVTWVWSMVVVSVAVLVESIVKYAQWVDLTFAMAGLQNNPRLGDNWLHLLSATAIWVGLPLVIGFFRLQRKALT